MVPSVLPSYYTKSLKLPLSNQEWDARAEVHSQTLRDLDELKQPEPLHFFQMMKDPFVVRRCTLLVLRPDIFLPDNRPLLINTACALRNSSGPNPLSGSPTIPALRRDSSDRSFYDFDLKSLRQPQDSLSVFALLVNANSKLQNIMQTSQSVTLRFVRNVVAAIFHVPKEVRDQTPSLIPPSH